MGNDSGSDGSINTIKDFKMSLEKIAFLRTRVGAICPDSVNELIIFAENDGDLYRQSLKYINYNMGQFYKKGTFTLMESAKAYKPFIDTAAKKFGRGWVFSSAERWSAAFEMAENNLIEMDAGNFTESRN